MAYPLPYGLTERCLIAIVLSWIASTFLLGPIFGMGCAKTLITLIVVSIAVVVVFSIMTVTRQHTCLADHFIFYSNFFWLFVGGSQKQSGTCDWM